MFDEPTKGTVRTYSNGMRIEAYRDGIGDLHNPEEGRPALTAMWPKSGIKTEQYWTHGVHTRTREIYPDGSVEETNHV